MRYNVKQLHKKAKITTKQKNKKYGFNNTYM